MKLMVQLQIDGFYQDWWKKEALYCDIGQQGQDT